MNKKVIRNFSMTALMLGAMFLLTSTKAHAENSCEYCSQQMQECMLGSGEPAMYNGCQAQLDECVAGGCYY